MDEVTTRALIRAHFAAAGRDEIQASEIYAEDAILDFPQGNERIRGNARILAMRSVNPSGVDIQLTRTIGCGELWVNEGTISYGGTPSNDVSIMEFRDGKVIHETIYVAQPWVPPKWRAEWVESMTGDPGRKEDQRG